MRTQRRKLNGAFKAKVALAAIRGDQTINAVASHYEVHPTQVRTWRKQLLEGATDLFSDRKQRRREESEALVGELYRQIGQLKVELDWLKKKAGYED